jgi:Zn-dependent protease with chaperone function
MHDPTATPPSTPFRPAPELQHGAVQGFVAREGQLILATVSVGATRLAAVAVDGEALEIGWPDLELTLGGSDGTYIYATSRTSGRAIVSRDHALTKLLRAVGDPGLAAQVEQIAGARRRERSWHYAGFGILLALLVTAGLLIWNAPNLLAASVVYLPTDIDRALGDAAFEDMALEGPVVDDPVIVGFVDEVVDRLDDHASVPGFEFRVLVVDAEVVNAFALPGGQIVVFTGLLRAADDAEEVAGVLAHEMAHVTRRHGMRNVAHGAATWLAVSLLLGDANGWVLFAGQLAATAKSNGYSRVQESDADAEGVRMMMAGGLDPSGLARFFARLQAMPGSELAGAMTWLSTHPDHQSRIDHVHELAASITAAPRQPLTADFGAVKAALAPAP